MKIYHGTSLKYLNSILKNGIEPRGKKDGNWETAPSRSDMVYLSTAYPFYFSRCCLGEDSRTGVVFEVDTEMLDKHNFHPDEDFIWQVLKRDNKKITIEEVRDDLENYQANWQMSIDKMGNCCYYGTIFPDYITRYCVVDFEKRPILEMAIMNPSISILNYKFCEDEYRGYVSWFFGDIPDIPTRGKTGIDKFDLEKEKYWTDESKDRTNISIVTL